MAAKQSEAKKTETNETKGNSLKSDALSDLDELRKMVGEAIDSGAKSVEQVHQAIAAMPLKYLEKIDLIEEQAKGVKDLQEKTIGQMYKLLRTINTKTGEFAEEMLKKVGGK